MKISPFKLNLFLMVKLPAAFITGVRATYLDSYKCEVSVRYKWINQNPFNSMFWAVQGMAAELATGALVMSKIKNSSKKISMLVATNKATFTKKATGKIKFACYQGAEIDAAIKRTIETAEGQTVWLNSTGVNSEGVVVSNFDFEWTLKLKT